MLDFLINFMESAATVIEAFVLFYAVSNMAIKKFSGKKYYLLNCVFVGCYYIIITLMNRWQVFSFATIGIGILFVLFYAVLMCKGNFLLKLTAVSIAFFFLIALQNVYIFSYIMITEQTIGITQGLYAVLNPGVKRFIYLLTDKIFEIIIVISCKKLYSKLKLIGNMQLTLLLVISFSSFVLLQVITGFIISDSIYILQLAVVLSILFIIVSMITSIAATALNTNYQNKKTELELIRVANSMMDKNYSEIKAANETIRQQVHDFKNHIIILDTMLADNPIAKEYTQQLLSSSSEYSRLCHSGNDTIDAIINCKSADARLGGIDFNYNISLPESFCIDSVDICSVLANQLDNAIEACERMSDNSPKKIDINIYQKESFVYFVVINTVAENPFNKNNELVSSKKNDDKLHGFGTKIIRDIAKKYNGDVKNTYKDGFFKSVVMMISSNNT